MTDLRVREDRKTEETAQRRRRDDATIDGSQRLKLAIPPEVAARLKSEGRTPRWAIKDSARMEQLTKFDDYDPVDGVATVPTRSLRDGERIEHILLSKPTAFIEDDRAKAEAGRREQEDNALAGQVPGDPNAGGFYTDPANKLERRGQRGP